MVKPKTLKKGDRVAIIAPSSSVAESDISKIKNFIENMGLDPYFFPSCFKRHGHLSGTDEVRARDVNDAFRYSMFKGVICIRGGYGTPRILNMIDYDMIRNNPKFFLGYSDITGLHTVLNNICHLMTYHGPMASARELFDMKDEYTINSLRKVMFDDSPPGKYVPPEGEELEILKPGRCSGILTGGNLSLLVSTLGSKYEIDARDKVLFIEEVNELNYAIDRMLMSLELAGKFEDCSGIILGTWKGCSPSIRENGCDDLDLEVIFREILGKYEIPIINNFRAGHVYPQFTIPLGGPVNIDTDSGTVFFG